jgi:nitrate reductase gamma subunit
VRAHGEGGPGDSRPNGTASRDVGATPESRARQTRRHGTLLWLLLPYLALAGVVLGHVWRWRHDAFGWRTFRTPLVEHRLLRLGSPLVHLGVVAVFVGHLVGLLVPTSWTAAVGITNATYHLISVTAGTIAGAFMLAGLVLLVARRILQRSIRRTTTVMDLVALGLVAVWPFTRLVHAWAVLIGVLWQPPPPRRRPADRGVTR